MRVCKLCKGRGFIEVSGNGLTGRMECAHVTVIPLMEKLLCEYQADTNDEQAVRQFAHKHIEEFYEAA